jgi:hypothetical protein
LPRAAKECAPWLKRQHPFLDSPEIDFAVAELGEMLKTPSGMNEPDTLVLGWLSKMVAKYGETFPVEPIPADDHDRIDPVEELRGMVGEDKVIVIDSNASDG